MDKTTWGGKCPTWAEFIKESVDDEVYQSEDGTEINKTTNDIDSTDMEGEIVKDDINSVDDEGAIAVNDMKAFDDLTDDSTEA